MGKPLSNSKNSKIILSLVFAVFSLGQLPGFLLDRAFSPIFTLHLIEFLILLFNTLHISYVSPKNISKVWFKLGTIMLFSMAMGTAILGPSVFLAQIAYATRFLNLGIFIHLVTVLKNNKLLTNVWLAKVLLLSLFSTSIFGFFQYLAFFDMRFLYQYGWDDHLGRMSGLLFDPAFFGITMVLGFIVTSGSKIGSSHKILLLLMFVTSILLSFSRASYVAFLIVVLIIYSKRLSTYMLLAFGAASVLIAIALSHWVGGEGVNLMRVSSIFLRLDNLLDGAYLLLNSPLFGFGIGGTCQARFDFGTFINASTSMKNSCHAFDNLIINLLLFGGLPLLFTLTNAFLRFCKKNVLNRERLAAILAVLVHSMTAASAIYVWVILIVGLIMVVDWGKLGDNQLE